VHKVRTVASQCVNACVRAPSHLVLSLSTLSLFLFPTAWSFSLSFSS
jgi:hypothetical protein